MTDGSYEKLSVKNIDTGAGLARLTCILQDKSSNYETDLFSPLMQKIEEIAKVDKINKEHQRIIADHIRAACFLISAGIRPIKEDRGYVLRRIIRRAMRYGKLINDQESFLIPLVEIVINIYSDFYPELSENKDDILKTIEDEEAKFDKTLEIDKKKEKVLERINKLLENYSGKKKVFTLSVEDFFDLYQRYGYPLELSIEEINRRRRENGGIDIPEDVKNHFSKLFYQRFKKHQEISRAGAQKKFGGVGIDNVESKESKEKVIKLHTATHLLHQALRDILGESVQQAGSDINPDRLRFDFTYSQKLTEEEKDKIEEIINKKIQEALPVTMKEMSYKQAIEGGALAFFREKYPEVVKVYSIGGNSLEGSGSLLGRSSAGSGSLFSRSSAGSGSLFSRSSAGSGSLFSREICAGPHVKNTKELGQFKIIKEKSSSAGIRRIKATLH